MVTDRYQDCFLYVDASHDRLADVMRKHLAATDKFGRFKLAGFDVDVTRNKTRLEGKGDDFVEWPARVEVFAGQSTPDEKVVAFVRGLMTYLRSAGYRVVAACDFEDELPQTDFR